MADRREIILAVMLTSDGDASGYTATCMTWAGEGGEQVLRKLHERAVERRLRAKPARRSWRGTKAYLRREVARVLESMFASWQDPKPIALTELEK